MLSPRSLAVGVSTLGLVVAMAVIGGAESLVAATIGALGLEFLIEALRS